MPPESIGSMIDPPEDFFRRLVSRCRLGGNLWTHDPYCFMFSDRRNESRIASVTVSSNSNTVQRKNPNKATFFCANNSSSQFWRG
jgi:hypothetical protein